MKLSGIIAGLAVSMAWAQGVWAQGPTLAAAASAEQADLAKAVDGTSDSPLDFMRGLESHLAKYPATAQRASIEDTIVKAAIDANENRWIAAYGEKVLARQVTPDLAMIERVARALLEQENAEAGARALGVAQRYENAIREMGRQHPSGHLTEGQWALEVEKGLSRACSLQAHALGNMGTPDEAAARAVLAWNHWPTGEAAREAAYWLEKQNKPDEAIAWYANAFAVDDPRTTTEQRAKDRERLGELYRKAHGSEKGLAELILTSYDGAAASRTAHIRAQKDKDPNIEAASLDDYQFRAVEGQPLRFRSLKGKTVVLDFWATWCVPCIAQHPMIEHVKQKLADKKDVVFVALDSDDDRSLVPGFIREQKWDGPIYYESGAAALMKIGALPTIVILNGEGRVISRMSGYIPEKFESILEQRILNARESPLK